MSPLTSVEQDKNLATPEGFRLYQNYPNPFNPTTIINYELGAKNHVSLKMYDVLGREVATLVNGAKEAGRHEVLFDASRLPSGMYFCRMKAGAFTETKKLTLIR